MTVNNVGIYASQISGHLWAPNGAMDALATVTVPSGGVATIEFAGIPQGYKHLQIRGIARATSTPGTIENWYCRFNGDAGNNYSGHRLAGSGSVVYAQSYSSGTAVSHYFPPNASTTANVYGAIVLDILDYSSTTKNKTVKIFSGNDTNGAGVVSFDSSAWYSTAAITSIKFFLVTGNYAEYSQLALYGVK